MSPVNVNAIGEYLREQGEQARNSIRQLAQAAGASNPVLSQQIAKGLRISADALYVQAGILDDREGTTSVAEAITADQEISDRQKQMLIEIYESFRKQARAESAARTQAPSAPSGDPPGQPAGLAGLAGREAEEAVEDAVEQSDHDPVVEAVAAAEAEPWAEPPAPRGTG